MTLKDHHQTNIQASGEPTASAILLESRTGFIAELTLNRPHARNSLSAGMLEALLEAFSRIGQDPEVKVIILSANGPGFCAGHDLKEITAARTQDDKGRAFYTRTMNNCAAVMQAIIACPKPVIASVQGIATAAGCQLVASCDLALAVGEAKFATPGVHIGLFCSTPMVALSRNIPRKHALEMLLTGELISAEQAASWGLINRVVAAEQLQEETRKMAELVAGKPSSTVKIGKQAFYKQLEMPLHDAYQYAAAIMVENMLNKDAEEGIGAFIEKRAANFHS